MSLQPRPRYSFDDYLAAERECVDQRHEYLDGEVFAMTGASWEHNLITANLVGELHAALKGHPCRVLTNDLRVYAADANAGTYPDVAVLCGAPEFYDQRRDTLINPTLLIEVLSPSTEGYDRGGKFASYRTLPSLRQYVLVAQDRQAIDVFTRETDQRWVMTSYTAADRNVVFDVIDCTIAMTDLYAGVEFGRGD
ncbi:MAG: Uma2 family endonuclease [Thiohalocapsa sp.]|uniref:Uma2 family endonuclease n=1 Tax=Thiohalocapsa sp. TaxID=2497641 RepID=UPI0025FA10AF|nr:Uma2 family endonuclease [Thiohalocapsa sp.]MCG6942063.1 Uma2 family endonuclease [Thiohalocapsa sp.]